MKVFFYLLVLTAVAASGCIRKKASSPKAPAAPAAPANAFSAVPGETPPTPAPVTSAPAAPPVAEAAPTVQPPPAPTPVATTPPEQHTAAPSKEKVTVTLDTSFSGKVATVNSAARFVVLSFPVGHLPPLDQHLNVNRRGVKVAELKVTGPQLDENIVADIVSGDALAGDEVTSR